MVVRGYPHRRNVENGSEAAEGIRTSCCNRYRRGKQIPMAMARSERFELPTLGIEIRCSIQLSYERINVFNVLAQGSNFLEPLSEH